MSFWVRHIRLYRLLISLGVRARASQKILDTISKRIKKNPVLVVNGLKMKFDPRSSQDILIYDSIEKGAGYEPGVTKLLLSTIKKGMTFVDVGANSGYYTLLASGCLGRSGKIIALEPQSIVFRRLKDNVKINKIKNVILLHKAAYSERKKVKIGIPRWGDAETSIDYPNSLRYENVDAVTIDSICKNPDIIKIDVEGYELEVLQGAKKALKNVKCIVFEQNIRRLVERDMDPNIVINFLKREGFNIYDSETGEKIESYRDAVSIGSNFYAKR